jgi:hypothetical protein
MSRGNDKIETTEGRVDRPSVIVVSKHLGGQAEPAGGAP